MNSKVRKMALAVWISLAATVFSPLPAFAIEHGNKTVSIFHSPDARGCAFFILNGVNQSDPITPNSPWFAVSKDHVGFKEIVATLLMARATGVPLQHVATTGAMVCGHAEVSSLSI